MDDTISRQAAIKNAHFPAIDDASYEVVRVDDILALPPAQPGWIPCSPETMPETEGRYVCTYIHDGKKDVFMFRFEDGGWIVPWYVNAITAWYKPLDPWEGGQE